MQKILLKVQKIIFSFLLSFFLLLNPYSLVLATNNPHSVPNNSFGIHIFSEKDIPDAKNLVNSEKGDWGYVTVVITEKERDHNRWQKVFDQMRRSHLIPIVRIATKPSGSTWEKPKEEEINNWIAFLNSLNWVIQNRYVIIANEPNHAKEWGGEIKPDEYATYLKSFALKLHEASSDFFVLPAGLDFSASNTKDTMEATKFLREMLKKEPEMFNLVDGWNSHSYPNPGFSGKATDRGRGTIAGFDWELSYLRSLGVTKNLPVFITETGWSNQKLTEEEIGLRFKYAYQNIWNDKRVVAVTPFILNYDAPPFEEFSWQKNDGSSYSFYEKVRELPKIKGEPVQIEKGEILANMVQPIILSGSDFVGLILTKNTGQSIWNTENVLLTSDSSNILLKNYSFNEIEPGRLGLIVFKAASPENTGIYSESLFLQSIKGNRITENALFKGILVKIDRTRIAKFFKRIMSSK